MEAYTRLFRLRADSTRQERIEASEGLCQRVLDSLEGRLPGHTWSPNDSSAGGAIVDLTSIVGAAAAGSGAVTITAAPCECGAVLTSAGCVVAPGPSIVGSVTRGSSVRRFLVLVEPKRMARSSVALYVQGHILCGNNGQLVAERDSVLAFVARCELVNHEQGLLPTDATFRDCFYQVGVDAGVQTSLLHYANLNQALARLLLPEQFESRVGTRTVLLSGAQGQRNRIGKAGHAQCRSHFKIRYRNSEVKRGTDECSCGERITYRSRGDGGVSPPSNTTTNRRSCPLSAQGHNLVSGVYISAGSTQHSGHYEARLPNARQKLRNEGAERIVHLRDFVHLTGLAIASVIRDEMNIELTGKQALGVRQPQIDPRTKGIVGLLHGLEGLSLPHVIRWLCAPEHQHQDAIGKQIWGYELVVPDPTGGIPVKYDVTGLVGGHTPGAFEWSVAESLMRGRALPTGIEGFKPGGTAPPPGYQLRADSVIWADQNEIRECCRCMHAAAFDTTHNTSDQAYTYLAMMFKNGHGRSVQGLHGMLRGETQAAFSSFYTFAYPLIYGRAVVGELCTIALQARPLLCQPRMRSVQQPRRHKQCGVQGAP